MALLLCFDEIIIAISDQAKGLEPAMRAELPDTWAQHAIPSPRYGHMSSQ